MANVYVDALVGESFLDIDQDGDGNLDTDHNTITYRFANDVTDIAWTEAEKTALRSALQKWADVADISFEERTSGTTDLVEHKAALGGVDPETNTILYGQHAIPADPGHGYYNTDAFNFISADLAEGSILFQTFVHELGHAIGLAHPHDPIMGSMIIPGVTSEVDRGTNNLNTQINTIMSYNAPAYADFYTGQTSGPMAFDIAAIQTMYGANTNFNNEDTLYTFDNNSDWSSIWDTGGTDTIQYTGTGGATIDLRSATLREGDVNAGGYLSSGKVAGARGGFTIAADYTNTLADVDGETGVIIENADGSSGDDSIFGNKVANIINGGGGQDTIFGNDGNDTIHGGSHSDTIHGGAGEDTLFGDEGRDSIFGGLNNDTIEGGRDNDTIDGGSGFDTSVYHTVVSKSQITLHYANDSIDYSDYDSNIIHNFVAPHSVTVDFIPVLGFDNFGTDTLTSIEQLRFDDVTLSLNQHASGQSLMAKIAGIVDMKELGRDLIDTICDPLAKIFIGYTGRVPQHAEMMELLEKTANGMSLDEISKDLYQAGLKDSEHSFFNEKMSTKELVSAAFENVLEMSGRTAPSDKEIALWSARIDKGAISKETLIKELIMDAQKYENSKSMGWVTDLLDNKADVAVYHALELGIDYNSQKLGYEKTTDILDAISVDSTAEAIELIGVDIKVVYDHEYSLLAA
jgi:serralysin